LAKTLKKQAAPSGRLVFWDVAHGARVIVGTANVGGAATCGVCVKTLESTILNATRMPNATKSALAIFKPRLDDCWVFLADAFLAFVIPTS